MIQWEQTCHMCVRPCMCVCVSPMRSCLLGRYGSSCLRRDLPLPIFSMQGLIQMNERRGGAKYQVLWLIRRASWWLDESKRASSTRIRGINQAFTPSSLSDADSLTLSGVAAVSCSMEAVLRTHWETKLWCNSAYLWLKVTEVSKTSCQSLISCFNKMSPVALRDKQ